MPRKSRVDAPGAVHHIIIRGIEEHSIFRDDVDRNWFVDKLSATLKDTGTACYAWVLMRNHVYRARFVGFSCLDLLSISC